MSTIKNNKGFATIISALIILAVGFVGLYEYGKNIQTNLSATIPVSVAVWESTLASSITATDVSATLVTGTSKSGADLDGYMCFVISGGKLMKNLFVTTASSTSLTGMIRGIDTVNPNTTSTAMSKAHRAGSNIKITDYPQLAILSRIMNGDDTFLMLWPTIQQSV